MIMQAKVFERQQVGAVECSSSSKQVCMCAWEGGGRQRRALPDEDRAVCARVLAEALAEAALPVALVHVALPRQGTKGVSKSRSS